MTHISHKEFAVCKNFQCIKSLFLSTLIINVNNQCPNYRNGSFSNSFAKEYSNQRKFFTIKMPLPPKQRRPDGAVLHPYGAKPPDMLKRTNDLNTFKHNLKQHFLKELNSR